MVVIRYLFVKFSTKKLLNDGFPVFHKERKDVTSEKGRGSKIMEITVRRYVNDRVSSEIRFWSCAGILNCRGL